MVCTTSRKFRKFNQKIKIKEYIKKKTFEKSWRKVASYLFALETQVKGKIETKIHY